MKTIITEEFIRDLPGSLKKMAKIARERLVFLAQKREETIKRVVIKFKNLENKDI